MTWLAALLLLVPCCAWAAPVQVVSVNLCADQLLVHLAPERVAALSPLARDPAISEVADIAAAMPWVRADAEAILALHPDLVLGGRYGAQPTIALLRQRGVPVDLLDMPSDFAGIRTQVREVAELLNARAAGEAWLGQMEERLAARRPWPVRAVMWEPRGWTSGPGSLGDSVMREAGLRPMTEGHMLGLEALLADPPDVLIVARAPDYPSLATDLLRHPATQAIRRVSLPPAWLICATPESARAVARLRR